MNIEGNIYQFKNKMTDKIIIHVFGSTTTVQSFQFILTDISRDGFISKRSIRGPEAAVDYQDHKIMLNPPMTKTMTASQRK